MGEFEGRQTVLLVEDESSLLWTLGEVLRRGGYQVLKACGAPEALLLQDGHPGTIHLTVTDVGLPEMSGPELANRLRELRPGMPVLFMSGSSPKDISLSGALSEPRTGFLQKPFFANSLVRAVQLLLEIEQGEEDRKTDAEVWQPSTG